MDCRNTVSPEIRNSDSRCLTCDYQPICLFIDLIQGVKSTDEFAAVIKNNLKNIFLYKSLIFVLAEKSNMRAIKVINIDCTHEFISKFIANNKIDFQLFDNLGSTGINSTLLSTGEITISHGMSCPDKRYFSFLSCLKKSADNDLQYRHVLKLIAPYLHNKIINLYYSEILNSKSCDALSPREIEVLKWVSKGKTNSEIGIILNVSTYTVKNHVANILCKLKVSNRTHALEKAITMGYF